MKHFYIKWLPSYGTLIEGPAIDPQEGEGEIVMAPNPFKEWKMELCFHQTSRSGGSITAPVRNFPQLRSLVKFMCTKIIRPGSRVWWNDPERLTSDYFTVQSIHSEDGTSYEADTIIYIRNEFSEAEVYAHELDVVLGPVSKEAIWTDSIQRFGRLDWQWASVLEAWEPPIEGDFIKIKCPCCGQYS